MLRRVFVATALIEHVTDLDAHMAAVAVAAWSALLFLKSGDRQRPFGAGDRWQKHSAYPDRSWRTAGRKLCWSPAAPPASGYESPSCWPKMKRSVTMVNAPSSTLFIWSNLWVATLQCWASYGFRFPCKALLQLRQFSVTHKVRFRAQRCVLMRRFCAAPIEISNPGDIGYISLCKDWDSVAPLV